MYRWVSFVIFVLPTETRYKEFCVLKVLDGFALYYLVLANRKPTLKTFFFSFWALTTEDLKSKQIHGHS